MATYPCYDYVVGFPSPVQGIRACPICGHTNLHWPAHTLKVDSNGLPFTYTLEDSLGQLVDNGTFPTYYSWRCLDNNHSFELPTFQPDQTLYPGFVPLHSGSQRTIF